MDKRKLYESIMKKVSAHVKRAIHEGFEFDTSDIDAGDDIVQTAKDIHGVKFPEQVKAITKPVSDIISEVSFENHAVEPLGAGVARHCENFNMKVDRIYAAYVPKDVHVLLAFMDDLAELQKTFIKVEGEDTIYQHPQKSSMFVDIRNSQIAWNGIGETPVFPYAQKWFPNTFKAAQEVYSAKCESFDELGIDEQSWKQFKAMLGQGVCQFIYTKVDGTVRMSFGTNNPKLLREYNATPRSKYSPKSWPFFDVENEGWRSISIYGHEQRIAVCQLLISGDELDRAMFDNGGQTEFIREYYQKFYPERLAEWEASLEDGE